MPTLLAFQQPFGFNAILGLIALSVMPTPRRTWALSQIQPFSNDCRVMSETANANVIFLSRGEHRNYL